MTANTKLTDWLKSAGKGTTQVEEPIFISAIAEKELRGYHPCESPACRFALALDTSGNYAVFTDASGDWLKGERAKFLEVHKSVKLKLVEDPERDDYLFDAKVEGQKEPFGPSNWRVTEWKLFRYVDSVGDVDFLRDEVKWVNDKGEIAYSFYDWRPYNP